MTKAYIAGFRKAAADSGFNPDSLIGYTGGEFYGARPTKGAIEIDRDDIPMVFPYIPNRPERMFNLGNISSILKPRGYNIYSKDYANSVNLASIRNRNLGTLSDTEEALHNGTIDPKYWGAHTTAVDRVTSPVREELKKVKYGDPKLPVDQVCKIIKDYHNEMASLTGMPRRVVAVAKKK